MIGYIDVGGGMRAVYGAGILDRCLDESFEFPYYIGVSAGSANVISFLARQKGRNLRFYRDYSLRKDYMSFANLIKNKSFLGLDYIYTTLTNEDGEDPLDFERVKSNNCEFYIVSTDADTGKTIYLDYKNMQKNDYFELKASSCIPMVCPPYEKNGINYYDGGISDPIPVKKALADGCDRLVVTLTLPADYHKPHKVSADFYKRMMKSRPESAKLMYSMIDKYNEDLDYLKELEKQGKALILSPDDCCGVNTLKRPQKGIEELYRKGYNDGGKIKDFICGDTSYE